MCVCVCVCALYIRRTQETYFKKWHPRPRPHTRTQVSGQLRLIVAGYISDLIQNNI